MACASADVLSRKNSRLSLAGRPAGFYVFRKEGRAWWLLEPGGEFSRLQEQQQKALASSTRDILVVA